MVSLMEEIGKQIFGLLIQHVVSVESFNKSIRLNTHMQTKKHYVAMTVSNSYCF